MQITLPHSLTGLEIFALISETAQDLNFNVRHPVPHRRPSRDHIHCSVWVPSKKFEHEGRIYEITRLLNIYDPHDKEEICLEGSKEYKELVVDLQAGTGELIDSAEIDIFKNEGWHKSHLLARDLFVELFFEKMEISFL